MPNIGRITLVDMRLGSHLYGTATPESDTDHKAVFLPGWDEQRRRWSRCGAASPESSAERIRTAQGRRRARERAQAGGGV